MTKKKEPDFTHCVNCGEQLPEGRYKKQKFCSNSNKCGVAWRSKNVYRYKYTHKHRSESPLNFLRGLLQKNNKDRSQLDIEFLVDLWNNQGGLCAISNLPMTHIAGKGRVGTNASIDQIIANAGYTKDNVQLVTYDVNRIKGILTMTELYELCQIVINNRKDN